jgi:FkbM family methyltransferase
MSARLAEALVPVVTQTTPAGDLKFVCAGEMPEWRARTFLTKEPETLEWIDGFADGATLWDIGANVGLYSLYAARRGLTVLAFEPSAPNYYLLNRNIEANRFGRQVSAYCLAFGRVTGLDLFYMSGTELGGARNSFAEPIDWRGQPLQVAATQAMVGYSVDEFIQQFEPPFPSHIKIDVDGIEDRIIEGAPRTLADRRLKSLLVELDTARPDYCRMVEDLLGAAGLRLAAKRHAAMFDNTEYASSFNHIFTR